MLVSKIHCGCDRKFNSQQEWERHRAGLPADQHTYSLIHPEAKMVPVPDYGDFFSVTEWKSTVLSGAVTPNDGHGFWAFNPENAPASRRPPTVPSPVKSEYAENTDCWGFQPSWANAVIWFNK